MKLLQKIIIVVLMLAQISCSENESELNIDNSSFSNRSSILTIKAELGILKYTCENDTVLLYIHPHNEDLPGLIINDQKKIQEILSELFPEDFSFGRVDNDDINCEIWGNNLSQIFDIQISVSGEVKESFDGDSFFGIYSPFVASNLTLKKECEIQYQIAEDYHSLVGSDWWYIIDLIVGNDTISPTCEQNLVGVNIYSSDEKLIMDIDTGVNTCYYEVAVSDDLVTILNIDVCTLGIPVGTKNMWNFDSTLFDVLQVSSFEPDTIGQITYSIQHNILTLINQEKNSRIRLFAK